ncbi:DNA-binding response regulator [Dyadobacter luteus]|uniref:DNA-binding response regulator n=1 Tax=Dyadobacter luteus TaxID=2259619 RepID=A0A3D8YGI9_9BACT|nr:response regulator transcription factor [Dyadobacter luteus]REA63795.1 DNA-binding response regulator [Dyadobacter luteus]
MNDPIKIIIADDHLLFIDGLKRLLEDDTSIKVINIANNGKELMHILQTHLPDLILMDINMPKMNGLSATQMIRQAYPHILVIMLSTYNEKHLIEKARESGANGYLIKDINKNDLLITIRKVLSGESGFPNYTKKNFMDFQHGDSFLKQSNLTKREIEIIQLIKTSQSNRQIADQLFLSIYTVETHRKNIMQKLGLNSPGQLMRFILENGL